MSIWSSIHPAPHVLAHRDEYGDLGGPTVDVDVATSMWTPLIRLALWGPGAAEVYLDRTHAVRLLHDLADALLRHDPLPDPRDLED